MGSTSAQIEHEINLDDVIIEDEQNTVKQGKTAKKKPAGNDVTVADETQGPSKLAQLKLDFANREGLWAADGWLSKLGFGQRSGSKAVFDRVLFFTVVLLVAYGFVMISSASMPIGQRIYGNHYHFIFRQAVYIGLGLVAAVVVLQVPLEKWHKHNVWLLASSVILLIVVLMVGRTVNGATRWILLGPINIQAAEPAKLFFFAYLSSYLVRKHEEVLEHFKGFVKPLLVFFVAAILLLNQPDLGTVIVMFITTLSLLFLAGAKLWQFFALIFTGIAAIVTLIWIEPYRMARVTSFMDPWEDPYGKGYQLTQSLMAYGRGDWFGQGLGNSVQKLAYLPEAHTDFVMAVLAEELGLTGVLFILALLLVVVFKAMLIGQKALKKGRAFEGFFAMSIGVWFSFQTMVNVGGSAGALPTKGLTFPLVSYGGSSLIVMFVAVAVLLRIDFEMRMSETHTTSRGALS